MTSPLTEEYFDDVGGDFRGTTLQLDPSSGQPSRTVSPLNEQRRTISSNNDGNCAQLRNRPILRPANSDCTGDVVTPPTPPEIMNNFYGYGMGRSFYEQPPIGHARRASWHADTGIHSSVRDFFSVRIGALDRALDECRICMDPEIDGDIKGAWLLTEITHWDVERERVAVLCDFSVLVVKYDFIGLRRLEFCRIHLRELDQLSLGDLTYPTHSLVPRISGIAGGVVTVIRDCLLSRLQQTLRRTDNVNGGLPLSAVSFEPRSRRVQGLRLSWGRNCTFTQMWNPWSRAIPFTTFTSHPLFWVAGGERSTYDVQAFAKELGAALETIQERPDTVSCCNLKSEPVIIENYVGFASLLHNVTELGFFKLRGRISF